MQNKRERRWSGLKTSPAWLGHVNITPVITAVDFGQFSLYNTGSGTSFLPRDAMHKRGLCCHAVSVRLSVCVSVTFVSCVKTNKDIFKIFSPSGSQAIIEFYALVNLKPQ